jgi:beta-glucosidase
MGRPNIKAALYVAGRRGNSSTDSYTTYDYANLRVSPSEVSIDVTNSGGRAVSEVVQLYLNDVVTSVSRPLLELRGFQKIALEAGQTKTARFRLTHDDLSLLDAQGRRAVEPGKFKVMIGRSSTDIRLTGEFEIKN